MENLEYRELARKYNHTYANIYVKKHKETIFVYFDRIGQLESGSYHANVYVLPKDYKASKEVAQGKCKYVVLTLTLSDFDILDVPDSQVFDCQGRVIYYSRNPARQWQKGVCSANSRLSDITYTLIDWLPKSTEYVVQDYNRFNYSLENLEKLFLPNKEISFNEALDEIVKYDIFSKTINNVYFISLFPDNDLEYILFRLDVPIAYYKHKIDTFILIDKIYTQEMKDFLRYNNLTSKLEVDDDKRYKNT